MGSGYGFALSGILFIVWVVIGKPMGYSDDWWLIIGTTTGVIGTFNAAVLRFTLQQEERTLDKEYDRWAEREGRCTHRARGAVPRWVAPTGALLAWDPLAHTSAALMQIAACSAGAGAGDLQSIPGASLQPPSDGPPPLHRAGWQRRSRRCSSSWACRACTTRTSTRKP